MHRKILALIYLMLITCWPAQAEKPDNIIIVPVKLPVAAAENQVYEVDGKNGMKAWGLQHRLFIKKANVEVLECSPEN